MAVKKMVFLGEVEMISLKTTMQVFRREGRGKHILLRK